MVSQPPKAVKDWGKSVGDLLPVLPKSSAPPAWATSEDAWATAPSPNVGDGWSEDPARTAGESNSFSIDGVEYMFRWAPAGTFRMGSGENVYLGGDDEKVRSVKLTRGFWMLETEVTQAMWQSVMGNNPSFFKGGDFAPEKFPVEGVSWNDAVEFCKKASRMKGAPKGYEFRLPTEAQWEYACRAGTRTRYSWESRDSASKYCAVDCTRTLPVGEFGDFEPNNWGIYDMHGNVREWRVDKYGEYTGDATDPAKAVRGPGKRVCRGGAWNSGKTNGESGFMGLDIGPDDWPACRSAARDKEPPETCEDNLGFRVILVPSQR